MQEKKLDIINNYRTYGISSKETDNIKEQYIANYFGIDSGIKETKFLNMLANKVSVSFNCRTVKILIENHETEIDINGKMKIENV